MGTGGATALPCGMFWCFPVAVFLQSAMTLHTLFPLPRKLLLLMFSPPLLAHGALTPTALLILSGHLAVTHSFPFLSAVVGLSILVFLTGLCLSLLESLLLCLWDIYLNLYISVVQYCCH